MRSAYKLVFLVLDMVGGKRRYFQEAAKIVEEEEVDIATMILKLRGRSSRSRRRAGTSLSSGRLKSDAARAAMRPRVANFVRNPQL